MKSTLEVLKVIIKGEDASVYYLDEGKVRYAIASLYDIVVSDKNEIIIKHEDEKKDCMHTSYDSITVQKERIGFSF